MKLGSFKISRWKVGIATVAFGVMLGAPALAESVTQDINIGEGSLTASFVDTAMDNADYSHAVQNTEGTLALTVDDSTGTGAGWNVTVAAGNFVGAVDTIPAAGFTFTGGSNLLSTAGQAVDDPNGPNFGTNGALDTARVVLSAPAGFGQGTYTSDLAVDLEIPGTTKVGSYTSDVVVTVSSGS